MYAVMRTAPFCGEEVANHHHRQLEREQGTGWAYSDTVGEDIRTIRWLRRAERTHQVEMQLHQLKLRWA
jgi:hypothetical protein